MVALVSVLLSLLPVLGPSNVEAYQYPDNVARSSQYVVMAGGKNIFVLPAGQPHIAQFGSDAETMVTIQVRGEVRTVDIRPISKGYEYELSGNTIRIKLKPLDRISVEVNDNTESPLFVFVNPLEAQEAARAQAERRTLFFGAGKVYDVGQIEADKYDNIYIQGGAIVRGNIAASSLSRCSLSGCGIIDCRSIPGNAVRYKQSNRLGISNLTVLNRGQCGLLLTDCVGASLENVKVVNVTAEKIQSEQAGFCVVGSRDIKCRSLFVYSQSAAYSIRNKMFDVSFPVNGISLEDCIGWNNLTSSTLIISGSDDFQTGDIGVAGFYALHSATGMTAFKRSAISIQQQGSQSVRGLSFRNISVEDPQEYVLSLSGCIRDVLFKDVDILKKAPKGSILRGTDFDNRVEDVRFENITMEGRKISSLKALGVKEPSFGLNVVFK